VRTVLICLALLALASACHSSEATSTGRETTGQTKANSPTGLRRPLHLPTASPGAGCPVTPGGRPSPDVAVALGSGPAYPVLGYEGDAVPPSSRAFVPLYADERRGGMFWHKTLWAVDPDYDGSVLIRGAGIDPPRQIGFAYSKKERRELVFPAQESDSWRYGPSFTILPGPGCYAFQIDGIGFSRVIVFKAATASTA
jgi:hypothetical protein